MLYRYTATAVPGTAVMYEYVIRTASTAKHITAQRNHPCTKLQTKYVPIRVRIKEGCTYMYAVSGLFSYEHVILGICKSLVCT